MRLVERALLIAAFLIVPAVSVAQTETAAPDSTRLVELIDEQFRYFNAHELEPYVAMFTDDIKVFKFPDTEVQAGIQGFTDVYAGVFESFPSLTATPTIISVDGAFVTISEVIENGPGPTGRMTEVAIFEFDGEMIRRFWFFPPRPVGE
jgi:hypothetical protein